MSSKLEDKRSYLSREQAQRFGLTPIGKQISPPKHGPISELEYKKNKESEQRGRLEQIVEEKQLREDIRKLIFQSELTPEQKAELAQKKAELRSHSKTGLSALVPSSLQLLIEKQRLEKVEKEVRELDRAQAKEKARERQLALAREEA